MNISKNFKIILILITILLGVSYANAAGVWNNPTQEFPSRTISEPINSTNSFQSKLANVSISQVGANTVSSDMFCITNDSLPSSPICITAWPSGGGDLTGSGNANYLAKWTGNKSLGDSNFYYNNNKIGINKTNPNYTFDVNGNTNVDGYLCVNGDCRNNWPTFSSGGSDCKYKDKSYSNGATCAIYSSSVFNAVPAGSSGSYTTYTFYTLKCENNSWRTFGQFSQTNDSTPRSASWCGT